MDQGWFHRPGPHRRHERGRWPKPINDLHRLTRYDEELFPAI
ncbi:MAG TPA: hypothetical protein DEF41_07595 [Desulfovibrio sp.]|uniref:Uncharacterized protein n=1 Tax=Nitratidesulfovibrio vulgaris (strain ATCC 29579 / DSM 644 / CCUG 34227 / NCIMB 8303 / VKM B-1760 / Hildenborough) TaxID=882 RepID=Q728R1_NITV2|nr:hypothetical protein DVU_2542 [Nitratidesulfovibrio vulgaris str. Hildenborough]HBW15988.1 hypothetical protein [Desulfovibrio sp.]